MPNPLILMELTVIANLLIHSMMYGVIVVVLNASHQLANVQVIFAVTVTTMTVPFLHGKTLLRDFNTQSGFSSGFSGFSVVFGWFFGSFCKNHFRQNNE